MTRIQISAVCMTWIGSLLETREKLIASVGPSVKDRYVPYKIVIPLGIRQFYRDTGGKVLEVAPENEVKFLFEILSYFLKAKKVIIAMRKNFEKPPRYGTSTQVHFSDGEKGLVGDA